MRLDQSSRHDSKLEIDIMSVFPLPINVELMGVALFNWKNERHMQLYLHILSRNIGMI